MIFQAHFICRISVVSNAIREVDNETAYLITCCLNGIRRDRNLTHKTGLNVCPLIHELDQVFQITNGWLLVDRAGI